MSGKKPPQEVSYIIHVEGVEEFSLKKQKPKFPGNLLGRFFGPAAGGALTGGRHCAAAIEQGPFDHSTIPAVLARLHELNKRQRECLEDILSRSPRMAGYDYTRRETVQIWVGPASKLQAGGAQPKFYPGDAFCLDGDAITAQRLSEVLIRCDSAESRARAVAEALAPAKNPKLMRPLNFKK